MKYLILISFLLLIGKFSQVFAETKFHIFKNIKNETILAVNNEIHKNYGLAYPVTYQFELPQNSSALTVHRKFNSEMNWEKIIEKTSNDFFNGIEVVRFDYNNNLAFISVAFSSISDSIYLTLTNDSGEFINTTFLGICKYYDNRDGVVTTTADDLIQHSKGFSKAFHAFRSRNLWLSCGAVTGYMYEKDWQDLQKELDLGFVEIDSHSKTHKHPPYEDIYLQVVGSKNDLINNLNLPSLYKNGNKEYIYSYIYPFGGWGTPIDSVTGRNGYLINRTVDINEYNFTNWNFDFNMFNRVGAVYEVGGVYQSFKGVSDINMLKQTFDRVIQNGDIYHFTIHPNDIEEVGDWEKPYMNQHLDYICNRKNVWYVGFGHLYLYHYIASNFYEEDYLNISPDNIIINRESGNFNISVSSNTSWQVNENTEWLSASPLQGENYGSVLVYYGENPIVFSREASLSITNGTITKKVNVLQLEKKYLEINPSQIEFQCDSSSVDLTIYSNTNWQIHENTEWISLSDTSGSNDKRIMLYIDDNLTFFDRFSSFILTDENITLIVEVKQSAKKFLNVSPSNIEFNADSCSFELVVNSNTEWHINENIDWLIFSPSSGNNDTIVSVFCCKNNSANFRESYCTISDTNLTTTIYIKQFAKKYIEVLQKKIELENDSSSFNFIIYSNTDWQITNNNNWLNVDKFSGLNIDTILVNYSKNSSEDERKGTLSISNSSLSDTLFIYQTGSKYFEITLFSDSLNGGIVVGGGKYIKDKFIAIVAIPNEGWKFKGWYEDSLLVSIDSIYTFEVTYQRTLIAKFIQISTNISQNVSLPIEYSLSQNYPNPFNPTTTIHYSIPLTEENVKSNVKLAIYNILGKEITTLVNEYKPYGDYEVTFNASTLPSGIYYYVLSNGKIYLTNRMVYIK